MKTGPKSWKGGEIACSEVLRDEYGVHLHKAEKEDALVQIDLFCKRLFFRGQGPIVVCPILSASKWHPSAAEGAIETAINHRRLEA